MNFKNKDPVYLLHKQWSLVSYIIRMKEDALSFLDGYKVFRLIADNPANDWVKMRIPNY